MESRQPWLCQLGSAKSLKSLALSPSCLSSPCGARDREQAGWLGIPVASASPVHPTSRPVLCFQEPSPTALHAPAGMLNRPKNPTQASGSLGHALWDCPRTHPAPNGCQQFALTENKGNVLGHARRSVANTIEGSVFFFPCRAPGTLMWLVWGCPVQGQHGGTGESSGGTPRCTGHTRRGGKRWDGSTGAREGSNCSCSYLGAAAKKRDPNTSQGARLCSKGQGPQVQTAH